jgi:hexosaminidase
MLSAATGFSGPDGLSASADLFRHDLAATMGIDLAGTTDNPAIRLELMPEDVELLSLPATAGRRADGGDPQAERYRLVVSADGVVITATTADGIRHGLNSLYQLAIASPASESGITIAPVTVLDAPRYAWRGLSFDVVRTFHPVETVREVIDLLALYKANVLHLHLTDHEGWRLEIAAWPKLAEVGGQTARDGRPGGFYTQDDYRGIAEYATQRGITVVPEFDLPGHTAAIFAAYPELAGDGSMAAEAVTELEHYFQWMHPDNPRVFPFVTDVLREIAALTPGDYIHIGGDEALGMDEALYLRFVDEVRAIVRSLGKEPIGWQESARGTLQPGDIVQEWIPSELAGLTAEDLDDDARALIAGMSPEMLEAIQHMLVMAQGDLGGALDQGADILLSRANKTYLDGKYGEPSLDPAQEEMRARVGISPYGVVSVRDYFAWDPATLIADLPTDRIVGVEGAIWCETITGRDDLFFQLLPRLPGVLEKAWAPAADHSDPATWEAFRAALLQQAAEWERRGLAWFQAESVWGT